METGVTHETTLLHKSPSPHLCGTGKTTHIRRWKQYLGDDVEIINGEKLN